MYTAIERWRACWIAIAYAAITGSTHSVIDLGDCYGIVQGQCDMSIFVTMEVR